MGFTSQSLVLLLNLINLVYLTETLNSTARSDSNKGGDGDDSNVTLAVVLGVCLTVIIFGCIGYFLCRGHLENKKFMNHRQLLKMERLNKNGKDSGSKTENEQSKDFAEEVL